MFKILLQHIFLRELKTDSFVSLAMRKNKVSNFYINLDKERR